MSNEPRTAEEIAPAIDGKQFDNPTADREDLAMKMALHHAARALAYLATLDDFDIPARSATARDAARLLRMEAELAAAWCAAAGNWQVEDTTGDGHADNVAADILYYLSNHDGVRSIPAWVFDNAGKAAPRIKAYVPEGEDKTRVTVLCGSTRFRDEFTAMNRELTLLGRIVVAPGVFQHDGDEIEDWQKKKLDELHMAKIRMADDVMVINPGGYIGESTAREIEYAKKIGKPVFYTGSETVFV